jgi:hypothetical protein
MQDPTPCRSGRTSPGVTGVVCMIESNRPNGRVQRYEMPICDCPSLGADLLAATLWPSIISALSGFAGVGVGGLITRSVSLATEDKRAATARELDEAAARRQAEQERAHHKREDERQAAVARGVARVLQARFSQLVTHFQTAINQNVWPAPEMQADPPLPMEEWKLLAGVLSADELSKVNIAEHSARTVLAARDYIVKGAGVSVVSLATPAQVTMLTNGVAHLKDGLAALSRVAA